MGAYPRAIQRSACYNSPWVCSCILRSGYVRGRWGLVSICRSCSSMFSPPVLPTYSNLTLMYRFSPSLSSMPLSASRRRAAQKRPLPRSKNTPPTKPRLFAMDMLAGFELRIWFQEISLRLRWEIGSLQTVECWRFRATALRSIKPSSLERARVSERIRQP